MSAGWTRAVLRKLGFKATPHRHDSCRCCPYSAQHERFDSSMAARDGGRPGDRAPGGAGHVRSHRSSGPELRQGGIQVVGASRGRAGARRAGLVPGSNGDGRPMAEDAFWQAFATKHRLAIVACRFTDKPHEQAFLEDYVKVVGRQRPGVARCGVRACDGVEASGDRLRAVPDVGHVGRRTGRLRVCRVEARARAGVRRQQRRRLLQRAGAEGRAERARLVVRRRQGSRVSRQHHRRAVRGQSPRRRVVGVRRRARYRPRCRPFARSWPRCSSKTSWRSGLRTTA